LLNQWSAKRNHSIKLGVRVPPDPRTGKLMGMDALTWARRGLIDLIVPTNFFSAMDYDMPIDLWRDLLGELPVILAAGFCHNMTPYPGAGGCGPIADQPEVIRGAAAAALHKGADRTYLFNYCYMEQSEDRRGTLTQLLGELGSLETLAEKRRRHIVTFKDFVAPGEPTQTSLPAVCGPEKVIPAAQCPGNRAFFRIYVASKPRQAETYVYVGLSTTDPAETTPILEVRLNCMLCTLRPDVLPPEPIHPVVGKMLSFAVPDAAVHDGYNLVEIAADKVTKIVWTELALQVEDH